MTLRLGLLPLFGALVLAGCASAAPPATGSPAPGATAAAAPDPAPTDAPAVPPEASAGNGSFDGKTKVRVEIASGPLAGVHEVEAGLLDCNLGERGSGATYQDLEKTEGMYDVALVTGEGGANPSEFQFEANFDQPEDPFDSPPGVEIDPTGYLGSGPLGTGTARLDDRGSSIHWTVEGTTEDGIDVIATIECGPVGRS